MNPAAQPSILEMLMPFAFIMVVFYFFILRPQSKKLKEQDNFIKQLKRGDSVFTQSGILGVIDGLTDFVVTLEIAPNVKIKVLRKQIAGLESSLLKDAKTEKSK